jgi:biotin operon repressor
MSRTILSEVDGFTPIIDEVVKATSLMSAVVFGRIWRFCQMPSGICNASLETISEDIGIDKASVMRHAKILVDKGYLEDLSPDLRNRPHTYKDTGKASLHMVVSGVAHSNASVAHSNASVAENQLKIVLKKDSKKEHTHAEKPDFVNLTVVEAASIPEIRIFSNATGVHPGVGQLETIWQTIQDMRAAGRPVTADRLRPFWLAWNARGYNAHSLNWLTEWAVDGKIPEQKQNGGTHAKPTIHPDNPKPTETDLANARRSLANRRRIQGKLPSV